MSKIYLISDTHFGHANIIRYANRPFKTVEEMNKHMIDAWNSTVSADDTVYHLGDVCMHAEFLPIIDSLNAGKKVLILGNHDQAPISDYLLYFDEVHAVARLKGYLLSHYPIHPQELYDRKNIHGHTHDHNVPGGQYINVSVENIGYKPVLFESLIDKRFRGLNKH